MNVTERHALVGARRRHLVSATVRCGTAPDTWCTRRQRHQNGSKSPLDTMWHESSKCPTAAWNNLRCAAACSSAALAHEQAWNRAWNQFCAESLGRCRAFDGGRAEVRVWPRRALVVSIPGRRQTRSTRSWGRPGGRAEGQRARHSKGTGQLSSKRQSPVCSGRALNCQTSLSQLSLLFFLFCFVLPTYLFIYIIEHFTLISVFFFFNVTD